MSIPTLQSINKVYQCASEYTVNRYSVPYDSLGRLSANLNRLYAQIGEMKDDQYWQKYFSELRRLRFDLCAAPWLSTYRDERIANTRSKLSNYLRYCTSIYPTFATPATNLLQMLDEICEDGSNSLLDKLIELTPPNFNVAWVIKESRLIPQVEAITDLHSALRANLHVIHYSQLNSMSCYDALVIVGSPNWFPPSIFTSPRARNIDIVHFNWMHSVWEIPNTFVASHIATQAKSATIREVDKPREYDTQVDSILLKVDTQRVAAIAARDGYHEYDEIDARCVVFEDETAIFVAGDQASTILVIDLEEHQDARVRKIDAAQLTPGTFLLVRTNGGGDYIVPIADQLMGTQAKTARELQIEWKRLLREYVENHGLLKTSIDLLDLGSEIANEVNVRNWIDPRNIKTRDQRDFIAIMRLIGLEERAHNIWHTMEIISHAHRKAGFQLRDTLLGLVDKVPVDQFKRHGKIELRLADDKDVKLTAYRVEYILPDSYKVNYAQLGVPFNLGR